jgi:superfamily II DNA or RNA helicase
MPSRPYQTALVYEITKLFSSGKRRLIVQLPTGGGKTQIASELVARSNAKKILYIVPSDEILHQTSASLQRAKVPHKVLAAGRKFPLDGVDCLLAMSQTLSRRLMGTMFGSWRPDLIFVDEAHKLIEQHRRVLEFWPCPVIGMTATPVRLDGKSLASLWPTLICGPSIKSLQRQGFLVTCRTVNAHMPDLRAIRMRRGDYDQEQLDQAYSADAVVSEAPEWWVKYAKGRRTIAFTPGIESSLKLVAAYRARGIRAEHVDGNTPKAQREAALERLRKHQIDVLFNCSLFVEGLDCIEVSCVQLLTATASLSRFLQQVGRGLRPARGKRDLLLLDHGGNTARHDRVDADRDWFSDGRSLEAGHKTCQSCGTIIEQDRSLCPSCYRAPVPQPPSNPLRLERVARAQSRATPPRACPSWAAMVARQWDEYERQRYAEGLPLDHTERYCRRLLRRAGLPAPRAA